MKVEAQRRFLTLGLALLAAAALEFFVIYPSGSSLSSDGASAGLGMAPLRKIRIALPILLVLGIFLSHALSSGKRLPRLKALFSQGGSGRLVLLLAWIVAASMVDELCGRSPYLLMIGLVAAALNGWRKPRLLGCGVVVGSASIALADILLRGAFDPERLAVVGAIALVSVATGSTIRNAILRSADRLNSLQRENEKLWELSFRDGLTGLFNRRYSQEVGAMLFARAKRYGENLHVLMLDIDHFKSVNDKLGHPVGDTVLKGIAGILVGQVRASDVVTRYGGEEFLVFLVQTEPEVVQFIANRIRDSISSHAFSDVPWQLTISIGVAGIKTDDTLAELVDRADKYLYASKHGGRNRVSGY